MRAMLRTASAPAGALLTAALVLGAMATHKTDAHSEGQAAARAGLSEDDNPYRDGGPKEEYRDRISGVLGLWEIGFLTEARKMREEAAAAEPVALRD